MCSVSLFPELTCETLRNHFSFVAVLAALRNHFGLEEASDEDVFTYAFLKYRSTATLIQIHRRYVECVEGGIIPLEVAGWFIHLPDNEKVYIWF